MQTDTTINRFDEDMASANDIPEAPSERRFSGPPRIYWMNGQQSKNPKVEDAPGMFWISEKDLDGFIPAAPWEAYKRHFEGNSVEDGYIAESCSFVFVARRSQPFRDVKEGIKVTGREWHDKWYRKDSYLPAGIGGPSTSVYTEWLTLPDGFYTPHKPLDAQAIVCTLVSKGMAGMAFEAIVQDYENSLIRVASTKAAAARNKPTKLPRWAFSIPIGPQTDKHGAPVFEKNSYGGVFQPPALLMPSTPDEITDAIINKHYVGAAWLNWGKEMYEEYKAWREELRVNEAKATNAPQTNDVAMDELGGLLRRYTIARSALIDAGYKTTEIDRLQSEAIGHGDTIQSASRMDQLKILDWIEKFAASQHPQEIEDLPFDDEEPLDADAPMPATASAGKRG
jgi:hypothetical protein